MSKNVKFLIGGLAVIVLLVGAIVALKLTEKPAEATDNSIPESRLQYEKSPDKIKTISVENSMGSYTIVKDGEGFSVEGLEDVSFNSEALNAAAESASKVATQKIIEENAPDLTKYGLNPAVTKVTVEFSDSAETVKTFLLGIELLDPSLTYFAFEGENTVYAVKTADFSALADFAEEYISVSEQ